MCYITYIVSQCQTSLGLNTCTHVQLLRAMDERSLCLYATMYMHEGKFYCKLKCIGMDMLSFHSANWKFFFTKNVSFK